MISILGFSVAAIFALLSLLHIHWALGGRLGNVAAVPSVSGTRIFNPSAFGTILVAIALFIAMLIVLGRLAVLGAYFPAWIFRAGMLGISLVFLVRAIGDFRFMGFFKTVSDTDFARWDTFLFSPLCLFIAAVSFLIGFKNV
jgi:hypothetical protein